jgi:rod shape-determining protein MreC
VLGGLVVVALALITISFREADDGPLHDAQAAVASALQPLTIAVERVARPFRDAYGWTSDLFHARSENERLRAENEQLRQAYLQAESALQSNVELKKLLEFVEAPTFPSQYTAVNTSVVSRPARAFEQVVVLPVGTDDGVEQDAPVVTADGLVGRVTYVTPNSARVTLLTDESSAVSARDVLTGATGLVEPGQSDDSLVMTRVRKEDNIEVGDEIVTSGWTSGDLSSLYPKNIPVGVVTSVGTTDTDLYQQVQIAPGVDFASLDAVAVLIPSGSSRRR